MSDSRAAIIALCTSSRVHLQIEHWMPAVAGFFIFAMQLKRRAVETVLGCGTIRSGCLPRVVEQPVGEAEPCPQRQRRWVLSPNNRSAGAVCCRRTALGRALSTCPVDERGLHVALQRELASIAAKFMRVWMGRAAPGYAEVDLVARPTPTRRAYRQVALVATSRGVTPIGQICDAMAVTAHHATAEILLQ